MYIPTIEFQNTLKKKQLMGLKIDVAISLGFGDFNILLQQKSIENQQYSKSKRCNQAI